MWHLMESNEPVLQRRLLTRWCRFGGSLGGKSVSKRRLNAAEKLKEKNVQERICLSDIPLKFTRVPIPSSLQRRLNGPNKVTTAGSL